MLLSIAWLTRRCCRICWLWNHLYIYHIALVIIHIHKGCSDTLNMITWNVDEFTVRAGCHFDQEIDFETET